MVERNLAKVEVASSRLVSRSKDPFGTLSHAGDAGVAQLVERNLAKVEVASSRLVSRSRFPGRRAAALLFYWTEFFEPKKRCFLHEVLQGIWYNPPLAVLSI